MRINFGIAFNNGVDTFSPDFIVKFKNGTVEYSILNQLIIELMILKLS